MMLARCRSTALSALALGLLVAASAQSATVGYWRFEEGSGTTASDSSASGNDGALIGDAAFLSDVAFPVVNEEPNIYSLSLDGTGDYVNIPDDPRWTSRDRSPSRPSCGRRSPTRRWPGWSSSATS